MTAIFSVLSALPWRWIGLAAAIAGGWFYLSHLNGVIADRETTIAQQRQQLETVAAANATLNETLDRRDRWQARQLAVLSADRDAALTRAVTTTKTIQVIRNAPPSDDAPVAPVLRLALDGLRRNPPAPDRGAKPDGAAGNPARPADLPGKP